MPACGDSKTRNITIGILDLNASSSLRNQLRNGNICEVAMAGRLYLGLKYGVFHETQPYP